MTPVAGPVLAWTALGAALLVAPSAPAATRRVRVLAARGRLAATPDRPVPMAGPKLEPAAVLVVAVALAGVLAASHGAALAVAAMVAAATAGRLAHRSWSRHRAAGARDELITALWLLQGELEAGARPVAALRAAADATARHRALFDALADSAAGGAGTPPAASGPAGERLLQAWRVSEHSGAPLATVVARLTADLDDERERHRQVAAALAGPRSSAGLLAVLPLIGVGLGVAMGAGPVHVLLDTVPGRIAGAIGVVLDALGVAWTMRITDAAERA